MPRSKSAKASSFHCSPAKNASMRPSMLDRSAMTSFLPGAATRQPRTADVQSSTTLSNSMSSTSAFMAAMPTSISACFIVGRGRFWGWNKRPPQRPVLLAPQNCRVPRRRPSLDAALERVRYLAGLVADACARFSSSARMSEVRSSRSSSLLIVPPRRSSVSSPSCRRWSRVLPRWLVLVTAPPVSAVASRARRLDALCAARCATSASSRSTAMPRSLIVWSSCHSSSSRPR